MTLRVFRQRWLPVALAAVILSGLLSPRIEAAVPGASGAVCAPLPPGLAFRPAQLGNLAASVGSATHYGDARRICGALQYWAEIDAAQPPEGNVTPFGTVYGPEATNRFLTHNIQKMLLGEGLAAALGVEGESAAELRNARLRAASWMVIGDDIQAAQYPALDQVLQAFSQLPVRPGFWEGIDIFLAPFKSGFVAGATVAHDVPLHRQVVVLTGANSIPVGDVAVHELGHVLHLRQLTGGGDWAEYEELVGLEADQLRVREEAFAEHFRVSLTGGTEQGFVPQGLHIGNDPTRLAKLAAYFRRLLQQPFRTHRVESSVSYGLLGLSRVARYHPLAEYMGDALTTDNQVTWEVQWQSPDPAAAGDLQVLRSRPGQPPQVVHAARLLPGVTRTVASLGEPGEYWLQWRLQDGAKYHAQRVIKVPAEWLAQPPVPADVSGHWAGAQIGDMVRWGEVAGYPDGTFRPDRPISRAEFTYLLVSGALAAPAYSGAGITGKHWAIGWIHAAARMGLLREDQPSNFAADEPIRREEVAEMISRLRNWHGRVPTDPARQYTDAGQLDADYLNAVYALRERGLMVGYADGSFGVGRTATRAEAVVLLHRLLHVK